MKKRVKEYDDATKEVSVWKWLKNREASLLEMSEAMGAAAAQLEVAATLFAEIEGLTYMRKKRPKMLARIRVFLDNMKGR